MKLLEKDIHDKQDTIISLRRQLDDIKLINLEMYKKLQVSYLLVVQQHVVYNLLGFCTLTLSLVVNQSRACVNRC